jgi:transcriptional regulator with XRE-family HTH domain
MKNPKAGAKRLGANIRQFRTSVDLSQKQLAKVAKVTQANVSQWESGKSAPPIKVIQMIKDLYPKVNTEWFFSKPDTTKNFLVDETKTQLKEKIQETEQLKKEVQRLTELNLKQEKEITRLHDQNEVLTNVTRQRFLK